MHHCEHFTNAEFFINNEINVNRKQFYNKIGALCGFLICEFLLASTFYSYAVIYSQNVFNKFYGYDDGLWAPVLYVACSNLIVPLSKLLSEYLIENKHNISKLFICVTTIFITLAYVLCSKILSPAANISIYGLITGTFTRLLQSHLELTILEEFDIDFKKFVGLKQLSSAFSLLLSPFLMQFLLEIYSYDSTLQIYGVSLLNIIPFALIVEVLSKKKNHNLLLYKSYNMDNITNSKEDIKTDPIFITDNPLEVEDYEFAEEQYHNSVENYYINQGVTILPQIPEENEDSSSINHELARKSLNNANLSVDSLLNSNLSLHNTNKSYKNECCSPYGQYLWRRRWRNGKYFLLDCIVEPVMTSLKLYEFHLVLFSKVVLTISMSLFIIAFPYMAMVKNQHFSKTDANFLTVYIAFSWILFFLISLPLAGKLSDKKMKFCFVFGVLMSAFSLSILLYKFSNDLLIITSLFYGFSYGIVQYFGEISYRNVLGIMHWRKVEGTLNVFVGIFIIIIYVILYNCKFNDYLQLFIATVSFCVIFILWIFADLFKLLT